MDTTKPKLRRTDSDDARREMDEATREIISAIHSEIIAVKAELREQAVKLETMKGILEVWANAKGFVTVVKWVALVSGFSKSNGCFAEVYFAQNQYLDISNAANRRKFISATGKPVPLGVDGSLPTGTAPLVYFHLNDGEAVANFATNRGTGGNFTITGTLDTATTSPSD